MNPILSLLIVLCSAILVIRVIHWLYNKFFFHKNHFLKKKSPFHMSNIKLLSTIPVDDKYKIVVISIDEKQKTLLIGPSTAIILDDQDKKKSLTEEISVRNFAS